METRISRITLLIFVAMAALYSALLPLITLAEDVVNDSNNTVDGLTDTQLWGMIAGALTAYGAAWLNKLHWSDDRRFATFFVLGLVVTAGTAFFTAALDFTNYTHAALYVIGGGVVWYTINKGAIKAFEARTSGEKPT